MNSSWLILLYLGLGGFGNFDTHLCDCICLGEYDRYSKKYNKYGDDK